MMKCVAHNSAACITRSLLFVHKGQYCSLRGNPIEPKATWEKKGCLALFVAECNEWPEMSYKRVLRKKFACLQNLPVDGCKPFCVIQGSYRSWKPGKSWNFIVAFSKTGKSWKKATSPGKFWKSVKLN